MRLDKNNGNSARKSWYLDPVFPLNFWLEKIKLEWIGQYNSEGGRGSYEDLNCSDELYKDVPSHSHQMMIFPKVTSLHHRTKHSGSQQFFIRSWERGPRERPYQTSSPLPAGTGRWPLCSSSKPSPRRQTARFLTPSFHFRRETTLGLMRNASGFCVQLYTRSGSLHCRGI